MSRHASRRMRAPEMIHPKTLGGKKASFEAMNDNLATTFHDSEVGRRQIIGNGNVERWSGRDLDTVWAICANLREGSSAIHDAVYVVGTSNPSCVKVGMATDPINRLAQLQTGNHERLFLHRVFWMLRPEAAFIIETTTHKFLEKKTKRLVGEWFACTPAMAHDTIINACRSAGSGFLAVTPNDGKEIKVENII